MAKNPSGLTRKKAEKMAARRDAFVASKVPLLAAAGLVERTNPNAILKADRKRQRELAKAERRRIRKARLLRYVVVRKATPEQVAILERRLKALPDDSGYVCDFWRSRLAERIRGKEWVEYQKITLQGDSPKMLHLREYQEWVELEGVTGAAPSPRKYDLWTCDLLSEYEAIRANYHRRVEPDLSTWNFLNPSKVQERREKALAALAAWEGAHENRSDNAT